MCYSRQSASRGGGFVAIDASLGRSDAYGSTRTHQDLLIDEMAQLTRAAMQQCDENMRELAQFYSAQHQLQLKRPQTAQQRSAAVFEESHTVIVECPVPILVPEELQDEEESSGNGLDALRAVIEASQQRLAKLRPSARLYMPTTKRRRSNRVPKPQVDHDANELSPTVRITTSLLQ